MKSKGHYEGPKLTWGVWEGIQWKATFKKITQASKFGREAQRAFFKKT